jgi:hypothetical protein
MWRMENQRSKPIPIATIALLLIISAAIVYVLSIGPSVWLRNHGFISQPTLLTIYYPLLAAADRFPVLVKLIGWWASLFSD